MDQNHIEQARADFRSTIWRLKHSKKRRASPSWSVPTELLVMVLQPAYVSSHRYRGQGLGQRSLEEVSQEDFLMQLLVGVRRRRMVPVQANFSQGCLLEKHKQKKGMAAVRMIHLVCGYWKCYFDGVMHEALGGNRFDEEVPAHFHGFVDRRRREIAMLTQRVLSWRLDRLKLTQARQRLRVHGHEQRLRMHVPRRDAGGGQDYCVGVGLRTR